MHRSIAHLFADRAQRHPERNFIGERVPLEGGKTGDWRFITYGEMYARAQAIAQALLSRGMKADTPLMILSGNSIRHATMMLGANVRRRSRRAGVRRLFADVGRSLQAQACLRRRRAQDDLRGAGAALRPRAGRAPARRRRGRDRDAGPRPRDDIVRRPDPHQSLARRGAGDGGAQSRRDGQISLHLRLDRHAQGRGADPWHDVRGDRGAGGAAHRAAQSGRDPAEPGVDAVESYLGRQYRLQQPDQRRRHDLPRRRQADPRPVRRDHPQPARHYPAGHRHRADRLRLAVRCDGARRKPARPRLQEAAHGWLWRRHAQPGHL
ncbi:MAG: AMP-binding protein [Rhizomicrobium sp.]